jgi:hypothetical protein
MFSIFLADCSSAGLFKKKKKMQNDKSKELEKQGRMGMFDTNSNTR